MKACEISFGLCSRLLSKRSNNGGQNRTGWCGTESFLFFRTFKALDESRRENNRPDTGLLSLFRYKSPRMSVVCFFFFPFLAPSARHFPEDR